VVVFVKLTHLCEIKHYGYIRGILALIIKMETFDIELSGRLIQEERRNDFVVGLGGLKRI
jgi:hypothetical protein